ncbi:hypothetical protein EVAR_48555_1 [Eumeta japonica]|uniref:Uncharacterized protein n=1 Tax=Eumeta variegata TaxID=151549 RepID=A0A4C1Y733_EUMVA|nr:hypothetical protein EVAR_48555_1 [Eumeta japonica]
MDITREVFEEERRTRANPPKSNINGPGGGGGNLIREELSSGSSDGALCKCPKLIVLTSRGPPRALAIPIFRKQVARNAPSGAIFYL